jgi:RHS repeat-associated protein
VPKLPPITLPKGGGSIHGIGEKFAANPATGTASLSIPLPEPPSRAGSPNLSLSYDSGLGNGAFGFGWRASAPLISRRVDKRLPQYRDDVESDVFLLAHIEDLVPELDAAGDFLTRTRTVHGRAYSIRRYRPRIEGLFSRIERWRDEQTGVSHWRSISRDNTTTLYGSRPAANSRIADPADPDLRTSHWLVDTVFDAKGNLTLFQYSKEDGAGVTAALFEQNRGPNAARYLKEVRYGNRTPYYPDYRATGPPAPFPADNDWMFRVVFDYGDHNPANPAVAPDRTWTVRPDIFSDFRSGFEVRTYRLCRRVLIFHNFAELGPAPVLTRSVDLVFQHDLAPTDPRNPLYSVVRKICQRSYVASGAGYASRALPPLELDFTTPVIDETVHSIDETSLEGLATASRKPPYRWTDLYREGSPGILTEQAGSWFYKRNISNRPDPKGDIRASFEPPVLVASAPSRPALDGHADLMDFADGRLRLVQFRPPMAGYFEQNDSGEWDSFTPFSSQPVVDWDSPDLRFIDLDGDGQADLFLAGDTVFTWFPAKGRDGFGPPETVTRVLDEDRGPSLLTADPQCGIFLADMTGDGLADIVRIRNGEACYWPNLGYGRFGGKIAMPGAPEVASPGQFDIARVRLADLDGTGTSDIVYLGTRDVRLYFNQCGNTWADPHVLTQFAAPDDAAGIEIFDLLGSGTACLVWSSPLPADVRRPLAYIDLMGGQKPHLLSVMRNNLGAETRIRYAPSTRFFLRDYEAGTPWITALPFPVQAIERVETYDRVSRSRAVSRYAYHHGYYDTDEREYRGFGMVERWDTMNLGDILPAENDSTGENLDAASYVPPALTRTWYHTGACFQQSRLEQLYRDREFYRLDPAAAALSDSSVPPAFSALDLREATRALKGSVLREEIYGLDNTAKSVHPFIVKQRNFTVDRLQSAHAGRPGIFLVQPRETIDSYYERDPADPRVSHSIALRFGEFGTVLESAQISYGRRTPVLPDLQDAAQQAKVLAVYSESRYTPSRDEDDAWLEPLGCESISYEVTGLANTEAARPDPESLRGIIQAAASVAFEETPGAGVSLRTISHTRTLYRKQDLSGPLPLGQSAVHAVPHETYSLAFTPGLVNSVFVTPAKLAAASLPAVLGAAGGYVDSLTYKALGLFPADDPGGNWWAPAGQTVYTPVPKIPAPPARPAPVPENSVFVPAHFFLPQAFRDAFGNIARVTYDSNQLLPVSSEDAAGNQTSAVSDYRVLQPRLVTDANGNRTEVAFDHLGNPAGTAVMGKVGEAKGDLMAGFTPDITPAQLAAFLKDPVATAASLLGSATTRSISDVERFLRSGSPACAATIDRETHAADLPAGVAPPCQIRFVYFDGLGRAVQTKLRAEDGDAPLRGAAPLGDFDRPGPLALAGGKPLLGAASPRWVGTGRTVYNNKGLPVREYEPFFSSTHLFEEESEVAAVGVTPVLFYDPPGRVIGKLRPDHAYEKTIIGAWANESHDTNDTVLQANPAADPDLGAYFSRLPAAQYLPTWHTARSAGALGPLEQAAAAKAAAHADTSALAHFDPLGRPFLTIADNGPAGKIPTRVELDISGAARSTIDAWARHCMRTRYDMLGHTIYQRSIDSGEMWSLGDSAGRPLHGWDGRACEVRYEYDEAGRPIRLFARAPGAAERLVQRAVYGERHPQASVLNLAGRLYMQFDSAGLLVNSGFEPRSGAEEAYDFKGNLLRTRRQCNLDFRNEPDWGVLESLLAIAAPATLNVASIAAAALAIVNGETFTSATLYDALNRPRALITPDGAVTRPGFNVANLLESVAVQSGGAPPVSFLDAAAYDAARRRIRADMGNGATRFYSYDAVSTRVSRLHVTAAAGSVQDLGFTYDPAGNLTHVRDAAIQTIYFNNQKIGPDADYTYDAIYRLIGARGREHLGLAAGGLREPPRQTDSSDAFRMSLPHTADGKAIGEYAEEYRYDTVGNLLSIAHRGTDPLDPGWTRTYHYEPDAGNPAVPLSNRLVRTQPAGPDEAGRTDYTYDVMGSMLSMPHLQAMTWDVRRQLQMTQRQAAAAAAGKTYYVYDAAGQRIRKVTARPNGSRLSERIYLGVYEIYREYGADGSSVALERQTLHVTDGASRLALIETLTRSGGVPVAAPAPALRYQFANHAGSISLELDDLAAIITYEEYFPYGGTSLQSGRSPAEVSLKRYRFSGRERDEESELNYHTRRYCAPWLGRWASADPAGLVDGPNLYSYARCNPISGSDPGGQETMCVIPGRHEGDPKDVLACPSPQHGGDEDSSGVPKASLTGRSKVKTHASTNAPAPAPAKPKAAPKPKPEPAPEPDAAKLWEAAKMLQPHLIYPAPVRYGARAAGVVGGLLETGSGVVITFVTAETVAGAIGGVVVTAHGIDTIRTNAMALATDQDTPSFTHMIGGGYAAALGADQKMVNATGQAFDIFGTAATIGIASWQLPSALSVTQLEARMGMPGSGLGNMATDLAEMTYYRAEVLAETRKPGAVVTGTMDTVTGEVFFGQNAEIPTRLHPILEQRLTFFREVFGEKPVAQLYYAGAHSEINSLNEALWARQALYGRPLKPAELGEFMVHNVSLQGRFKLQPVYRCFNCSALTQGVIVVPDDYFLMIR